ncbi:UNVERIFIED_CONTAM: movement protein [Sesamum calycinum]|uniref:Movement protein n=1 Tax=Sesamum calycinum TaxID=2727403 RepID=A0AAW2LZX5_9LAMI
MDLQPSQNNYTEGDRLQTSKSLSGFFSKMMVSNKTMERIMRQDSNLSPYDGFRIEGISKVLNQIGLNQRKHHIIYKVSSGNLYAGKLMFDIHPRITYNRADQDFSRVLTLHQDFKRKDLMKEGNRPYSITYRIAYALSNTHHSDLFLRKEYIELPRIFKEFAKMMALNPIRIPRIGGVDIVIKDHPVLDRTISFRTEFNSRMSFSEDRIMGYKEKEKDLLKALTPQEIRQPVVGRYEGMLEIAGHKILVAGVVGRENGSMTLGLSFLEDHKPWGRKGTDPEFAQQNLEFSLKKQGKPYLLLQEGNFSQKILILNTGIREAKIMIGGAFETPWFRQQGLIDSDSFYEESEEEIKNLKEALQELKTMDISEESKLSLENVRGSFKQISVRTLWHGGIGIRSKLLLRLKRNANMSMFDISLSKMNMEDKKDMQMIIKEHINLGLIEPGISAYSSLGFLIKWRVNQRNLLHSPHHKDNISGTYLYKNLAKYRKDFWPLLKETESGKWKWEEIHTQRVRELKQVCNNLPKLAIPQDEDELVVYTNANDYRFPDKRWRQSEANSIMLRLRHLRENLEELNKKFGRLAVNAQVAGQIQRADLDTVQIAIRTTMVASTSLWNDLQEPIRKASSSEMDNELRKHDPKHALRV